MIVEGSLVAMIAKDSFLRIFLALLGLGHLIFGIAGAAFPRSFFSSVPPWPPLHIGQIQIAGIFDLSMATAILIAASDVQRYASLIIPVGVVAEAGHALVRIGHVIAGDNPRDDLVLPSLMLLVAALLAATGFQRWRKGTRPTGVRAGESGSSRPSG